MNDRPRRPARRAATLDRASGISPRVRGHLAKAETRVEAYDAIHELNAVLGLARARCADPEIRREIRAIQPDLYVVGSAVATRSEMGKPVPTISQVMLLRLRAFAHRLEDEPVVLTDRPIPGDFEDAAAFDLACAICRRAERASVRYLTNGGRLQPELFEYLSRLTELLERCARVLEARHDVRARLRDGTNLLPTWSHVR